MEEILDYGQKKGASYIEILSSKNCRTKIEIAEKKIKEISSGNSKFYSIRLIYKQKVGMAYSYAFDFKKLVEKAIKNAKANDTQTKFASLPLIKKRIKTKMKINPKNISLEEKKNDMLNLDIRNQFKKISSLKLIYGDNQSTYEFYNSEGSELIWDDCSLGVIMWPFAKEGTNIQNFLKIERIKGGYELMEKARVSIKTAMEKAEEMLKTKSAKGGFFPTIVDHKLGGVFAHEAVGHACEADHVLMGESILKNKMNTEIGSNIINISDDGNIKTWGWTPFDSEGGKASKTQLIKKGILCNWLHSRETAGQMGEETTGNGRAQNIGYKVIPRMTTTFIGPGDSNFEEMLSQIKKGYYLKGSLGGQVDTCTGEFLFNAQEGYYIEKGEIKYPIKGVSLTGNILKTLHNIKLIAKDLDFGHGFCGKAGQHVPVSEGAPHVFIEKAQIGGSK
ncbi:MAG: TldD/PmbA family protein [Nanoarchaeota archaeon]|nr:TldD/PmbA family protein [Nanoarchaeota archaeon]